MKFRIGEKVRITKPYQWMEFNKTYEITSCMQKTHTGPYIIPAHYTVNSEKASGSLISENDLISLKELRAKKIEKLNAIS